MSKSRKILTVVAILAILVTSIFSFAVNVEARATEDWCILISDFQIISQAVEDTYPGYTTVLQRFLWEWNDEYARILSESGGIDGYFGIKTGDCVEKYQKSKRITSDRSVGPTTWGKIGGDLNDVICTNGYTEFRVGNVVIFRAPNDYTPLFYYFIADTERWQLFHTGD